MKDALGHGSNAHNAGIAKAVQPAMTKVAFAKLVADAAAQVKQVEATTSKVIAERVGEFVHPSGKMVLVSPSFENETGLRATTFGADGEAYGHREYPAYDRQGLQSEISMALAGGFKLKEQT